MAKPVINEITMIIKVVSGEVVDARIDYVKACSDCGERVSKSTSMPDINTGQLNAIRAIATAAVMKAEKE